MAESPAKKLKGFLAKFNPAVAKDARGALTKLQERLPWANRLVYDNYNALAIAFGASERASEIILSIAVYPRWVSLFLMRGTKLPDPDGLLKGSGSTVRHIVLTDGPKVLDRPAVRKLIGQAIALAEPAVDPKSKGTLIIKSVSAKQRPRR